MVSKDFAYSTVFRLDALPPYDFAFSIRKPAGWSLMTPFEIFEKNTLWTAMRKPSGELLGLKTRSIGSIEKPRIFCKVFSEEKLGTTKRTELSNTLTWMLNLREDIRGFYALVRRDQLVGALVKDLYGMRNTKQPDLFSRLILAVTLQMAPIARSEQMMTLLIKEYGDRVKFDGRDILYWPSVERIARTEVGELKERCKLGYRAKPLKSIAESIRGGFPSLQELDEMPLEEAKAKLMELEGIGDYSADIVSPHTGFALDVWSAKIFSMLLLGKQAESPRDVIPKLKRLAEQRWG